MKLYTEEQVNLAMRLMIEDKATFKQILDLLIPIELPSDDEIEDKSIQKCFIESPYIQDVCEHYFIDGAKWMKKQIYNQNNQTYDGVRIKRFIKDEGEQILNQNK